MDHLRGKYGHLAHHRNINDLGPSNKISFFFSINAGASSNEKDISILNWLVDVRVIPHP